MQWSFHSRFSTTFFFHDSLKRPHSNRPQVCEAKDHWHRLFNGKAVKRWAWHTVNDPLRLRGFRDTFQLMFAPHSQDTVFFSQSSCKECCLHSGDVYDYFLPSYPENCLCFFFFGTVGNHLLVVKRIGILFISMHFTIEIRAYPKRDFQKKCTCYCIVGPSIRPYSFYSSLKNQQNS